MDHYILIIAAAIFMLLVGLILRPARKEISNYYLYSLLIMPIVTLAAQGRINAGISLTILLGVVIVSTLHRQLKLAEVLMSNYGVTVLTVIIAITVNDVNILLLAIGFLILTDTLRDRLVESVDRVQLLKLVASILILTAFPVLALYLFAPDNENKVSHIAGFATIATIASISAYRHKLLASQT